MARPDGRVQSGQRLDTAFSARAWNRSQDAADIVLGDRGGLSVPAARSRLSSLTLIHVRNDSGYDVPMHGVLGLFEPVIDPSGESLTSETAGNNAKEFTKRPVIKGVTPTGNMNRFCVTVEPIASGSIGLAAVAGCLSCKIKIPSSDASYEYAVTRANDRTQLIASGCGSVRLLWHERVAGDDKWCLAVL